MRFYFRLDCLPASVGELEHMDQGKLPIFQKAHVYAPHRHLYRQRTEEAVTLSILRHRLVLDLEKKYKYTAHWFWYPTKADATDVTDTWIGCLISWKPGCWLTFPKLTPLPALQHLPHYRRFYNPTRRHCEPEKQCFFSCRIKVDRKINSALNYIGSGSLIIADVSKSVNTSRLFTALTLMRSLNRKHAILNIKSSRSVCWSV